MTLVQHHAPLAEQLGSYPVLVKSFERSLRAANRAEKGILTYIESVAQFGDFLARMGMPTKVAHIRREHVETWIEHLRAEGRSASTLKTRYTGLRAFFAWLLDEGEIRAYPMEHMITPIVPETLVPVLPDDTLRRILKTCEGKTGFLERRDAAILRLLMDTGVRLAELAGLKVADVDLDRNEITVLGKGRRQRTITFGRKTALGIDRYLRARAEHKAAASTALWLGTRNEAGLTPNGIYRTVRVRGAEAGIADLHPHQLRHVWTHRSLAGGMLEGDVMALAGWRSRAMLGRYGASVAAERAQEAQRRLALGDQL